MSLLVEGLTARAGGRAILSGVDLTVASGEIVALLGPSGSGKSMTARAALALPPPGVVYGGRVAVGGTDILAASEARRRAMRGRDVAVVFQEPATALNPVHSIGRQIDEPLRLHTDATRAERSERVAALLEETGLAAAGVGPSRYAHQLSGGQRQRVAFAIAMALSPKLVLADEPTSALDTVAAAQILNLLVRLVRQHATALLLITHDHTVAARADRVAVMEAGRVRGEGPTHAVLRAVRPAPFRRAAASRCAGSRDRARRPVLEVDRITVRRDGRTIVGDVSFDLAEREILAVFGRSGSGKTTLARAILGLVPSSGSVRLRGSTASLAQIRAQVQMVFQDPAASFDPRQTVERIVAEPLYRARLSRRQTVQRVAGALARVGLDGEMMGRKPHAFSGGQRQRIAIARALVSEPSVLIADEAVSALDAPLRAEIAALFASLCDEGGMGLLFITHDLGFADGFADRALVMDDGRIVEAGRPDALLRTPGHSVTSALAAAHRAARHPLEVDDHDGG